VRVRVANIIIEQGSERRSKVVVYTGERCFFRQSETRSYGTSNGGKRLVAGKALRGKGRRLRGGDLARRTPRAVIYIILYYYRVTRRPEKRDILYRRESGVAVRARAFRT